MSDHSASPVTVVEGKYSRLEFRIEGQNLQLCITGKIDESANLEAATQKIEGMPGFNAVTIDASGIATYNSVGIRSWVSFIQRIEKRAPIRFTVVSEAIVDQFLLQPGVLGAQGISIDYLCLPYICPRCRERQTRMEQVSSLKPNGSTFVAPAAPCQKCGSELEFDSLEDDFGAVLAHCR